MKHYPIVLSIAGSSCIGEAGIQADARTILALGAYPTTVITAIAVQDRTGIKSTHEIPADVIRSQIEFVMEGIFPDVVKIGLIGSAKAAKTIADSLRKYHPKYVVYDPVLLTSGGLNIPDEETMKIIEDELLRYTNLMTINLAEAELFGKMEISTTDDLKEVSRILAERYRIPVLCKGANFLSENTYDTLHIPDGVNWEYIGERINTNNMHGASTIFSAAIATKLASGEKLNTAIKDAREFIEEEIIKGNKDIDNILTPVRMQVYSSNRY
ncbi:hydroxymethylpyrimidine/phosphomethylpyrimidine kinase [Bacteroides sp. OttesenSCG-928-D19]|nr:hydroxymethylpyrimidine/phosphomethylpyrimidine kinase [Bacteroides sp. OttesenSCG-928-D19]